MNERGSRDQRHELVCERRVRIVSKANRGIEEVFWFRVSRLPAGTPPTTPRWMSTYRVEDGRTGHNHDRAGMDDVHALGLALAWIDEVLEILTRGNDVWVGLDPEYPYPFGVSEQGSTPKRE